MYHNPTHGRRWHKFLCISLRHPTAEEQRISLGVPLCEQVGPSEEEARTEAFKTAFGAFDIMQP